MHSARRAARRGITGGDHKLPLGGVAPPAARCAFGKVHIKL
jgi:hypothetical protein